MLGSFRYKPFMNHILLTNDAGYFCFLTRKEWEMFAHGVLPDNRTKELIEKHFWFVGDKENYLRSTVPFVQDNHAYLYQPTSLFILALTNRCNNACIYCQAHGCSKTRDMSAETARLIIDRIAESPSRHFSIEFQGGEPLYNFEAIKAIMAYAPSLLSDKRVEYNLVSNLSLLTDEIADFIGINQITVSTSLDGPKALHDLNRPSLTNVSSFESTIRGIKVLQSRGINVGAIQTTTKHSLNQYKDIINTYLDNGMNTIFLRPLTRLGEAAKHWDELGYSSAEFIEFYDKAIDYIIELNLKGIKLVEQHASIFLTKILGGFSPNYMELRSPCGAGIGQLAFTASGNVYTCDEGRMLAEAGNNDFCLGNIKTSRYDDWVECPTCKAVVSASLLETLPECCDCVYQSYCGVCPVVNYAMTGDLFKKHGNERCKIYMGMLDKLMSIILENDPEKMMVLSKWVQN